MKKVIKYDLACGQVKQKGFIGVDIVKCKGVDIVYDLTKFPWDFAKDNSCDEVFSSHFLEHLNGKERISFMEELYRILKPGGQANIVTPYYNSIRASQDPTHKWPPISEASYLYFNKQWREQNKLDHYQIKCDFDFNYGYALDPIWNTKNQETKDFAIRHYTNVVNDIQVILTKR